MEKFKSARRLEYLYLDDSILEIVHVDNVWKANLISPEQCTRCWAEDKVFRTFEGLLTYIIQSQLAEFEEFKARLQPYAETFVVETSLKKMQAIVLDKLKIRL